MSARAEQGTDDVTGRYLALPRVLCLITAGEQLLLLRGAPDKRIWPNLYNGVGGHVERGEDVRAAALREIAEETGLAVENLQLRGVVNIAPDETGVGVIMFVFTAQAVGRAVRSSTEGAPVWVGPGQLEELDLVPDLPLILPRALGLCQGLFFGHYSYDEEGQLVTCFFPPLLPEGRS
ncbi:MAG: NUDIX domain-containing protein [Anaerolineae bacterium]|nr:NUDIX domain-containing protein [Anaerolineae bacterium]